ncbi:pyridoxal phosphate-dependent aminotransferase [Brotonthovivens ammoniilytica]|uniref:cysteine-S-conjugate beta-lyase n=1 Tax=Brotonthovivens ammoniilytica TaxID=2981725 RepID=A0ABT2TF18_9FIRM|nr:MalY/PatB family protein [Brotonthovivens ammoniilytica]MCU6760778.1 pyridoxal phosphate-dependent aminotransferase [Brotonthovivens ammoniilytica]
MDYNFDKIIDRRGTASEKYDFLEKNGFSKDTLPMWVADMDFETVPEVKEKLKELVEHGIYGYTGRTDGYYKAVCSWFSRRFQWKIDREWVISTPGIVFALAAAVRAFTNPGDGVMIQQPVYYPFESVIQRNHRTVVNNQLKLVGGRYEMDFELMERQIREHHVKLFLLCSPHNPVGRVWTWEELLKAAEICRKYDVLTAADEIHCDFVRKGFWHTSFGTLPEEFAARSIICTAPSKTFNLAGLQASNIIISNAELRRRYLTELNACASFGAGMFGLAACQTAYETGEVWLTELLAYLEQNYQYVKTFLAEYLPKIRLTELEGTYLIWMDFREYHFSDRELEEKMRHGANLWLDAGTMFGAGGRGFMRMNIAVPRKTLKEAMKRLKAAFS